MRRIALLSDVVVLALACAACGSSLTLSTAPGPPSPSGDAPRTPATAPATAPGATSSDQHPPAHSLGRLPRFPSAALAESTAARLQALLDDAVADGTFAGITASVVVADRGSWAGASGSNDGVLLTPNSRQPTHSSAKTIVAAQMLRLVEEGRLDLDDQVADYLPMALQFFDARGATIRQVIGMRSGIPDLNEYEGFYPAEKAQTVEEVFRLIPVGVVAQGDRGSAIHYASTNYVLLGAIIEHLTGQPLAAALRAGVLDRPGLEGIAYTVEDALAADGWGVEATPASLARWGYELYGGFVVSEASLREMADFQGEWYGLGTFDFSAQYGAPAVGHAGESSVTTCCSVIHLVALPEEGLVISVQGDTGDSLTDRDYFREIGILAGALRDAAQA